MANVERSPSAQVEVPGLLVEGEEEETDVLHALPIAEKRESHVLLDLAVRTKDVLVASRVIEEVRRRLLQFRGGESKAEKEKLDKEAELKVVEQKTRAAAWAWYQHGNSAAPPIAASPNSLTNCVIPHANTRRASRFKTEALQVGSNCVEPRWDFGISLFDPYELASVSKQIDHALHENYKPPFSQGSRLTRIHRLRMSFPRSFCRSICNVVSTQEEMALEVRNCEYSKKRTRRSDVGCLNLLIHARAWDIQSYEQQHHHLEHLDHHQHHRQKHEHHCPSSALLCQNYARRPSRTVPLKNYHITSAAAAAPRKLGIGEEWQLPWMLPREMTFLPNLTGEDFKTSSLDR